MKRELTKQEKLEKMLRGCPICSYDEADGGLYRHCPKCQYEITKLVYELVIDDRKPLHTLGEFSNGLTKAQEEMFQLAEEECAEFIQAISKVRRHGMDSTFVNGDPGLNRKNLHEEAADVIACIGVLCHNRLLDAADINVIARQKLDRIRDPSTKRVHFITPDMIP